MKPFLSPKDLAVAIGVSESSLKRWTDDGLLAASRTAGGHRRISVADAVRFIRDHRTPVVNAEVLGFTDLMDNPKPEDLTADRLYQSLSEEDPRVSRGLILAMYLGGMSLPAICDGPVRIAMERIGELWHHGQRGIAIEHRAVDTCTHALDLIRSTLPPLPASAPLAIGGTPPGDPYTLPSLMVATILSDIGYRVHNLGANVPTEALLQEARHERATLAWLSVSLIQDPSTGRRQIESLADQLAKLSISMVVGGRGAAGASLRARPNLHQVGGMAELAAYARGLLGPAAAPTAARPAGAA